MFVMLYANGLALLSVILYGSLAFPQPSLNGTFTSRQSGPCYPRCACQRANRYFGSGERWTDSQDRCTINECLENGTIVSIYQGCQFNGTCKDVGSSWTKDCISYQCLDGQPKPYYILSGAGCKTSDNGCKMVGEIVQHDCDTLQCQVINQTLKMSSINTGCRIDGQCKRLNSFWHNGCSLYTCDYAVNGLAERRTLVNEIMYWPDGKYALFKPKSGCPVDEITNWADGYRKHFTTGQNYFPTEPSLAGEFKPDFFAYEFCTHSIDVGQHLPVPRFKTYWEPGTYCVFRSQGFCPRGFDEGFLLVDDHDAKFHLSDLQGMPPDGSYSYDTGFFFCCRSDGNVSMEITLPKENSFVLLMGEPTRECQQVKGMAVSVEQYTIDGSLFSKHEMNGSLPSLIVENGDITLSVCLYEPKQCGCPDGTGNYIPMYSGVVQNCIEKKCISKNGIPSLETVNGGCQVGNGCKAENAVWSEVDGETCTKHICQLVSDNNGTRFEKDKLFIGCSFDDMCIDVNTELYRECATRRCMMDDLLQKPVLKTMRSDCPWSGGCKQVNSTWKYGCISYRCENIYTESGYQQWNIEPIEFGCRDSLGQCFKVGENVTGQCYEAICKISSNKSMVYMDVTKGGCLWKEVCKEPNETWREGCHTYQCQWMDEESGYSAVINATAVSCEWKGKCYNENQKWMERCIEYQCRVDRNTDGVNWRVETAKLGCRNFRGKCVTLGANITDRCVTYECKKWGDRLGLDPVSVGCKWKGKCYLENSIWPDERSCVTYQCKKKLGVKNPVMQISVLDYGCIFNGTCKEVNSTWPDGCRTRKCVVEQEGKMITRSVAPITAGCDDEGLCRPLNYTKVSNSCMEYKCMFNDEQKDAFFTLSAGACRSIDNKCHKVNSTWTDKTSEMCLNYVCRREQIGFLSKMVEQQCRDADGICRPIGSQGFPATVKGVLKNDCQCVQNFATESGIAIQCKP